MSKIVKSIVTMFALVMCFSFAAMAQETTGSIEGTITDPNGAVVPGVEVTITNVNRNQTGSDTTAGFRRTVTTDANGFFRMGQIPPGWYQVRTTAASGFGVATANNVEVTLG